MKTLAFFDLETTGFGEPDPDEDRIVEFSISTLDVETLVTTDWTERVNPGIRIPPERTAIHGISNEDVAGLPEFAAFAPAVQALLTEAVLVGYNSRAYDTPIVDRQLREAGEPGLRREKGFIVHPEIDLYLCWSLHEPRSLESAARRFAGRELGEEAHSAEGDAGVLRLVLAGMIRSFVDLPAFRHTLPGTEEDLALLVEAATPPGLMDRAGKFRRREDGVVVFTFSKNAGEPVLDSPGMLEWMLRRDFPAETKAIARVFLAKAKGAS